MDTLSRTETEKLTEWFIRWYLLSIYGKTERGGMNKTNKIKKTNSPCNMYSIQGIPPWAHPQSQLEGNGAYC